MRRANEHLAATTLLRHSSLARRPESSAPLARSQLAPSLPAARCTNDPASRLLTATLREASLAQGAREGVDCVELSDDSDEAPREAQASAGASGGANGVSAEGASGGGGSAAVGGRRQAAAEAAQRAAARFANWEVGGEATAEPRHWPGPWATAMELAEGVERVREEREEARRERAKAPVTPRWRPPALEADNSSARDGASLRRSRPRRLFDLSISTLVEHVDAVESLQGVPDQIRRRYAEALAERRRLSPDVLRLLGGAHTGELVAPDCSAVEDDDLRNVLVGLDGARLDTLELEHVGRALGDSVAASFAAAHSESGLPKLATIRLGGAYRLSDDGVAAMLSPAPCLRSLHLTAACRLTAKGLAAVQTHAGESLTSLDLSHCYHLGDSDVRPLLVEGLSHLEKLNLSGLEKLSGTLIADIADAAGTRLKFFDLSDCNSALCDNTVTKLLGACTALQSLRLDGGVALTDAAASAIAANGRRLREISLARCQQLSSAAVTLIIKETPDLRSLSLNTVVAVDDATIDTLATVTARNLTHLDVSWCLEFSEDALGLLTDKCRRLKRLSVWGCRQVTHRLINGHGNDALEIVGHHSCGLGKR